MLLPSYRYIFPQVRDLSPEKCSPGENDAGRRPENDKESGTWILQRRCGATRFSPICCPAEAMNDSVQRGKYEQRQQRRRNDAADDDSCEGSLHLGADARVDRHRNEAE